MALLSLRPDLAKASASQGATRASPQPFFLRSIKRYVYQGDTALHIAAGAHRPELTQALIGLGALVRAANRRGAEPLHYAAEGSPRDPRWNPAAQAATIAQLIRAGADANAPTRDGATPFHRAIRTRSAAAVRALLEGGADIGCKTRNGSTPMMLARFTTGRSGSGAPQAKRQQAEIMELLRQAGAHE